MQTTSLFPCTAHSNFYASLFQKTRAIPYSSLSGYSSFAQLQPSQSSVKLKFVDPKVASRSALLLVRRLRCGIGFYGYVYARRFSQYLQFKRMSVMPSSVAIFEQVSIQLSEGEVLSMTSSIQRPSKAAILSRSLLIQTAISFACLIPFAVRGGSRFPCISDCVSGASSDLSPCLTMYTQRTAPLSSLMFQTISFV